MVSAIDSANQGPYDNDMRSVGVAPGTITLQLGNVCPPDPKWQYFTSPFGSVRPAAAAGPHATMVDYDPYGTDSKLEGALPKVNPQGLRWDIALIVGGGALLVALGLGFIATR